MAKHILLINGPNLNLLGLREPHIYGTTTLSVLEASLRKHCASLFPPVYLTTYQSNHEGAIIDVIHKCRYPELVWGANVGSTSSSIAGTENGCRVAHEEESEVPPVSHILINPGALTHTSVALRDALAGVALPFLEIHITNVYAREAFRHQSFLSDKAVAVVCGLGVWGYRVAVDYCVGEGLLGGEISSGALEV